MDCQKNLTSCVGCTKKHARCHWKDVQKTEVASLEGFTIDAVEDDEREMVNDGIMQSYGRGRQGGATSQPLHGFKDYNYDNDDDNDDDDDDDDGNTPLDDLQALEAAEEAAQHEAADERTIHSATPAITSTESVEKHASDFPCSASVVQGARTDADNAGLEQARQLSRLAGLARSKTDVAATPSAHGWVVTNGAVNGSANDDTVNTHIAADLSRFRTVDMYDRKVDTA